MPAAGRDGQGAGSERLRDLLGALKRMQRDRVSDPGGAPADSSRPPTDEELAVARLLSDEFGACRHDMGIDPSAELQLRLAVVDLARDDFGAARIRLEEALLNPPAEPALRAALHYAMYRALLPNCRADAAVGDSAAKHYQGAVELDLFLADFSPEHQSLRVVAGGRRGALHQVRDAKGELKLIRVFEPDRTDPSVEEMLALEAPSALFWKHPGLARVLDFRHGEFRRPYYVLEHLDGLDLDSAVRTVAGGGKIATLQGTVAELRTVAAALSYLHSQQPPWTVRTLNPRSIVLTRKFGPKLLEFGLDETIGAAPGERDYFTAPEVLQGRTGNPTADVYSFAKLFTFLLSGSLEPVENLESPVSAVLLRAVEADPDRRTPSVEQLLTEIIAVRDRMSKVSLEVLDGPCRGRVFLFDRYRPFTVGRSADATFRLAGDTQVSRKHLQVELSDTECLVKDLGSSNGTTLDGQPIHERLLLGGAVMRLGDTYIRIEVSLPEIERTAADSVKADSAVPFFTDSSDEAPAVRPPEVVPRAEMPQTVAIDNPLDDPTDARNNDVLSRLPASPGSISYVEAEPIEPE